MQVLSFTRVQHALSCANDLHRFVLTCDKLVLHLNLSSFKHSASQHEHKSMQVVSQIVNMHGTCMDLHFLLSRIAKQSVLCRLLGKLTPKEAYTFMEISLFKTIYCKYHSLLVKIDQKIIRMFNATDISVEIRGHYNSMNFICSSKLFFKVKTSRG